MCPLVYPAPGLGVSMNDAMLAMGPDALRAPAGPLPVNPAMAHMFIVNPLKGVSFSGLFSTHPPLQERIRRLRAMELRSIY